MYPWIWERGSYIPALAAVNLKAVNTNNNDRFTTLDFVISFSKLQSRSIIIKDDRVRTTRIALRTSNKYAIA